MRDRLLSVNTGLCQVLQELEWDNLVTSEWRTLESLLHPFAQFTSLVSGESFTTMSAVISAVMDLIYIWKRYDIYMSSVLNYSYCINHR